MRVRCVYVCIDVLMCVSVYVGVHVYVDACMRVLCGCAHVRRVDVLYWCVMRGVRCMVCCARNVTCACACACACASACGFQFHCLRPHDSISVFDSDSIFWGWVVLA